MKYFLLDVFTNQQFGGNPLAVFPDADELSAAQMQLIASELNLSETTFVRRATLEASDCTVRIFTPKKEVPMAGHPTIGTAWAILKHGLLQPRHAERLVFDEGVGAVTVDFEMKEGQPQSIVMHQPLPEFSASLDRFAVAKLLSLEPDDIDDNLPVQVVSCGLPVIIVPLMSLDASHRAIVRLDLLDKSLRQVECRQLFLFTRETESPDMDVHCRCFAPTFGVAEDPATGAAHGPLGSYLVKYGLSDGVRIHSEQGIEMGRPSTITVRIESRGDDITDVRVGGECVEVGAGTIRIAS